MPYSTPSGMSEHSGAYVLDHLGLRIHICAQVGVRFKLTIVRSPKTLISMAETEIADVMRVTIPTTVSFMVDVLKN